MERKNSKKRELPSLKKPKAEYVETIEKSPSLKSKHE